MRILFILYFLFCTVGAISQETTVSGTVVDDTNAPISFATILISEIPSEGDAGIKFISGTTTDDFGNFKIQAPAVSSYILTVSYLGFTTKNIEVSAPKNLGNITLVISEESLGETVITAKRPTIKKEAGKLVFNVENTSLSVGNTFDLLKKTPGVIVIDEEIKIKFSAPIIYINNKRVYLSPTEVVSLLQNTDASNIKNVEVITNPSATYDGATGTVLNINTSKAIAIGYKGSVNTNYTQGVFPKYSIGTSHFYKNKWLNFYGGYGFNRRKNFKEDLGFIRFFEPDGSTNSIWNSDFNRTTRTNAHQGNLIADFTLDEKQTISLAATFSVNPNETYDNKGFTEIRNSQSVIDSTFTTLSDLESDTNTISVTGDYKIFLGEEGSNVTASVNYTDYDNGRLQNVATAYSDPAGTLLRTNRFFTEADQDTKIYTVQTDLTHVLSDGTLEIGLKYSNIDSNSKLDFFDTETGVNLFNTALSDDFDYLEKIYASYVNFSKSFGKLNLVTGLRAEYTDIEGRSITLGETNTDNYFNLFPRISGQYEFNEKHSAGFAYTKSITRPGYQNLNPFRYFINENNFNEGNPNLVPAIKDKIAFNYSFNNTWAFEAYYETTDNSLNALTFQDNINRTLRTSESNLIRDIQYSFDIQYTPNNLPKWLYFYVITSTFYLENEFLAIESPQLSAQNNTAGFYGYVYSNFTLSKDRTFTADLTSQYISHLIQGSADYDNLHFINVSFRKSFWNKQASITAGVNDIFNKSSNSPVISRYLNQDNFYTAQAETRVFTLGFKYNFGNARLRDNNRQNTTDEGERL